MDRQRQAAIVSSRLQPHLSFTSFVLGFFFPWAPVTPSKFFSRTSLWLVGPAQEGPELAEARNSIVSAAWPGLEATEGKRRAQQLRW